MGGIDEMMEVKADENKVVAIEEHRQKRKPFHYWKVGDREFQLKLTSKWIEKVESKYGRSIFGLVMDDDLPALSVMLTFVQAAMSPWEHGITYTKLQDIYDKWVEDGGSQMELLAKVVIPTLAVSGFFTEKQAETIQEKIEGTDDMI